MKNVELPVKLVDIGSQFLSPPIEKIGPEGLVRTLGSMGVASQSHMRSGVGLFAAMLGVALINWQTKPAKPTG